MKLQFVMVVLVSALAFSCDLVGETKATDTQVDAAPVVAEIKADGVVKADDAVKADATVEVKVDGAKVDVKVDAPVVEVKADEVKAVVQTPVIELH